jgi:tRNA-splicing ligase RtcB
VARHYTDIAKRKLGLTGEAGNLAWLDLDSEEGQEYWRAMVLAGDYSAANHRIIHGRLSKALGEAPVMILENHHNYAWIEELSPSEKLVIHRKGATPAHAGDRGIIPGNMVSPAYIVAGKGNPESLYSASHGAGRQMSRNKARALFSRETLAKQLKQNGVELIGGDAEEAPEAYKDIDRIMEAQRELVKILGKFYPRIVRME